MLVPVPREVAGFQETSLDERAQAVVHRAQAYTHPLSQLPLGEFRVLVQQAQDLEPRLFLDFCFFIQSVTHELPPHPCSRKAGARRWAADWAVPERSKMN